MKYLQQQRGLGLVIVLAAVAVVGVAGLAVYTYASQSKGEPAPTVTPTPKAATARAVKVAEGKLTIMLPYTWAEDKLTRTIGDQAYQMHFQLNSEDYLAMGPASEGRISVAKQTKLKNGQTAYLLNVRDDTVVLSACPPMAGRGCSFSAQGKFLFVQLVGARQPGDQAVRPVDFTSPHIETAIADMVTMVESVEL